MTRSHLGFAFMLTFLAAYTLVFQVEAAPAGPLIKHLSSLLKWTTRSSSKIPQSDILMVVGAVIGGYIMCLLQQGFGPSIFSRVQQSSESEYQEQPIKQKPTPITESMKEEPKWPSFGQLVIDLSKLALEALGSVLLYFIPSWFRSSGAKKGITPLKDSLRMPEDDTIDSPSTQKLSTNASWFRSSGAKKGITPLKDSLRMPEDDAIDSPSTQKLSTNASWFRSSGAKMGLTPLKDSLRMPEDDTVDPPSTQKLSTNASWWRSSGAKKGLTPLKDSLRMPEDEAVDPPSTQKLSTNASWFRLSGAKMGLTPLKDSLRMPEDDVVEPPTTQRQSASASIQENRQLGTPNVSERYSNVKPPKIRSASLKDPSLSSKHRSSKRQEFAEFYAPGEINSNARSKSHKEKTRHRQRDKSGEAAMASAGAESKPVEVKPVDYDNPKFELYGVRSKYGAYNSYRY